MTDLSRRCLLALLGAALIPLPARARDGEDDDDDDSGRGRGRGRGGDEDRDRDDDRDRDRDDPAGAAPRSNDDRRARVPDLELLYPDGWVERIRGGRYELRDHLGRRVIERAASREDYDRMIALVR